MPKQEFGPETITSIIKMYNEDALSIAVIAEKYKTYPNKIKRLLNKHGYKLKTKSEAQKQALESGRHAHPTKGTKRAESTKLKISEKVSNYWATISDDVYEQRVEQARENWNNLSEVDRKELQSQAARAIRVASKEGSKLEKFVREKLLEKGYNVLYHKKETIENANLEIDIMVPELKTVIELDGPTHFYPIWGEESLKKHVHADNMKNGLLLKAGFAVIRVKCLVKSVSDKCKRDLLTELIRVLEMIKTEQVKNRFIEIELK